MTDVVIRAEQLSKKYVIGHRTAEQYNETLRDVIGRTARSLFRSARDIAHGRPLVAGDCFEEFWALRGVNFEIRRGDIIGIIGRNGAGKSTLLKILSRITEPTEGRVTISGRVASLLEVGTGFHPELSGRENIYLNGAILGMSHAEIRRKFDEIVEFAEVDKFLDTPVKRYSSGMYVRLAFSVAAHLEPEILIVDEVLAVGDVGFQRKCLGKMQDISGDGRTVLFVSHNMAALKRLCTGALLIERGEMSFFGGTQEAVNHHYRNSNPLAASDSLAIRSEKINVLSWYLVDSTGQEARSFDSASPWTLSLIIEHLDNVPGTRVLVWLESLTGEVVFVATDESSRNEKLDKKGTFECTVHMPVDLLNSGTFSILLEITQKSIGPVIPKTRLADIEVKCSTSHGSTRGETQWPGQVATRLHWEHKILVARQHTSSENGERPNQ